MMVMEKDDYQHVIRRKRIQVALMQPTADKEVNLNDSRRILNNNA